MFRYQNAAHPEGERCILSDLVVPFERMWSPRSWRNIDVWGIDFGGWDRVESKRQDVKILLNGVSDNYQLTLESYTNGSLIRSTIGRNLHNRMHPTLITSHNS